MKIIGIEKGPISASVLPDFGGVVSRLRFDGRDVIRMDENMLGLGNVLAGGIPVLFPFAGRSENNEAAFKTGNYTMPMHGFAKDLPFETARVWNGGCEISLEASTVTKRYYPFDFALLLRYEIEGNSFKTTARVENRDSEDMYFSLGFHPYFLTPDRGKTKFSFGLRECWDYIRADKQGKPLYKSEIGEVKLSDALDTVFWNGCAKCVLEDGEIGYRAEINSDDSFKVVTVCTTQKNASCIEPWQARPGAAARPDECRKLRPNECREYMYSIALFKTEDA